MNNKLDRVKFLMSYSEKQSLNENVDKFIERNNTVVITDWVSPDNKFVIFFDELYDIDNKTKVGNIWENFDTFKMFLKHSFTVSDTVPENIRESALKSLNNNLLIESKTNYSSLKPLFKQFLMEQKSWTQWAYDTGVDFVDWTKKTGEKIYKNVSDFAVTSYEGAKSLIGAISKGEWSEVLNILGQGALYTIRRLRDLMYDPVGIILDGILVATGIGKGMQFIAWGLIVALDIYEINNPEKLEKPMEQWQQYLYLGIDILGFIFTGGVAKTARILFSPIKSLKQLKSFIIGNKVAKETVETMVESADKVPGLLTRTSEYLSRKFPGGSTFLNGILSGIGWFIKKFVDFFKSILQPKTVTQALVTRTPIAYSLDKYFNSDKDIKPEEDNFDDLLNNAEFNI